MSDSLPQSSPYYRLAKLLIFLSGGSTLCAIFPFFLSTETMRQTHQWLGLGAAPTQSIFEYMARSLCIMYFAHGVLIIGIASDLPRYWPLARLVAILNIGLGLLLFAIDLASGMPLFWLVCEGPAIALLNSVLLWAHLKAS